MRKRLQKLLKKTTTSDEDPYLYISLASIVLEGISKIDFPGGSSLERLGHFYANDTATPVAFYLFGRYLEFKPRTLLASIGIGTFLTETVQGFAHNSGFDLYDYPCYVLGLSVGYGIDKILERKKSRR